MECQYSSCAYPGHLPQQTDTRGISPATTCTQACCQVFMVGSLVCTRLYNVGSFICTRLAGEGVGRTPRPPPATRLAHLNTCTPAPNQQKCHYSVSFAAAIAAVVRVCRGNSGKNAAANIPGYARDEYWPAIHSIHYNVWSRVQTFHPPGRGTSGPRGGRPQLIIHEYVVTFGRCGFVLAAELAET